MMDKDWQLYNKIAPKVQKSPEKQDEIIKEAAKNMGINISQPYIDKIRYYLERNMKKYDVEKLVYYEHYQDINTAIAREKQLKNWRRDKKEFLIKQINPHWHDLSSEWV